ncbi:MAG: chromosome segregation protein SMC [Pseudomonadota bacterium]
MKFTNIRMTGFKSFVEPTDFEIHNGLTGIVGPNGCGKSNVLEALRWVMGATSAKALRGEGMDAVIFSGTTMRPARNWAEVTLTLDNSDRTAPAEYNENETIEITRRILRKEDGSQSIYSVNGKEVRAKDVQLFFADASSGANSPALVRQGQVAELINAKPQNRRRLLEEAAGITGLHTRRHEAELRLRAGETNLERLDDVMGELETQKTALARQARQATRYRNLSGDIRRAEAMAAYLRWSDATQGAKAAHRDLGEIGDLLEETALAATKASTAREDAQQALDPLRMHEAEAGAALHRLSVARENLDDEARRATANLDRLTDEIARLTSDTEREKTLLCDADEAIAALEREEAGLRQREATETDRLDAATRTMTAAVEAQKSLEEAFDRTNRENAEFEARRQTLTTRINQARAQIERISRQITSLEEERQRIAPNAAEAEKLNAAKTAFAKAGEAMALAETAQQRAEQERSAAEAAELAARGPLRQAEQAHGEVIAERDALQKLLSDHGSEWPALIEEIDVEPGMENALAAALGDDLNASTDTRAPSHWSAVGQIAGQIVEKDALTGASLPTGTMALNRYVKAPPALARRLNTIGVVAREKGDRLADTLKPGQRLVSREGDLWRWDGLVVRAEARTAAAIRLEQRNRLYALGAEIAEKETALTRAKTHHEETVEAFGKSRSLAEEAAAAFAAARRHGEACRTSLTHLEKAFERTSARITNIDENLIQRREEKQHADDERATLAQEQESLPDGTALQTAVSQARDALSRARTQASEARAAHGDLTREAKMRTDRLSELGRERGVWATRQETARTRIGTIEERLNAVRTEHEAAKDAPAAIDDKRKTLLTQIGEAETARNTAADRLAEAVNAAQQLDKAARLAEEAASEAREARARLEAQAEAADARVEEATQLAHESCDAAPESLLEIAEHKDDKPLPEREQIDRKLERYKRERENLGGVNLRADEELQDVATRLEEFTVEREDCEAAIKKLRGSISSLNREARQRLLDAFETVNTNFSRLFTALFNGGQAELRLVDAEDPLEAGLEIYASPPGKKLTSMSLMSGGEQALTATSLIFAVFMANPAPVCVLDEVDAPLDDANTERFCTMLHEMARETDTRFIAITHHPLTMSRMDRLFGVTMIERGVSQLVSVDLSHAEQLAAAE